MCGRFTYKFTWKEIHDHLSGFVDALAKQAHIGISEAPARYNIAPTQPILVIKREGGTVAPSLMRWGLVPDWVEDPRDFPLIINARSETMAEKASFRTALKNRRCVVPANGYYEWKKNADGTKTPYYITFEDDRPMLFAGFYSTWMGPDGEEVDTAAIVTVPSNKDMRGLHARTPAILDEKSASDWLDTAHVNAKDAKKLVTKLAEGMAKFHSVSTRVNSPRNDDADLIVPVYADKQVLRDTTANDEVEAEAPPVKKASGQLDLF